MPLFCEGLCRCSVKLPAVRTICRLSGQTSLTAFSVLCYTINAGDPAVHSAAADSSSAAGSSCAAHTFFTEKELRMLPRNPEMLLSVINTRLRDFYASFSDLCDSEDVDPEEIETILKQAGYHYDPGKNAFIQ